MSRRLITVVSAGPIAMALGLAGSVGASAHVVKTYGPYTIAVGWQHEPTYAGQLNAVQLIVKDAHGNPVNDLSSGDLHVQITAGGITSSKLDFEPSFDADTGFGTQGEYDASVLPTSPGNYTFLLSASVHGTAINQSFTSGPATFDTVHDATSVEFPTAVPSTSEISTRVTRDGQRLQSALADAQSASQAAGRATALGFAGIGVGVVVGGFALYIALRSRRTRPTL